MATHTGITLTYQRVLDLEAGKLTVDPVWDDLRFPASGLNPPGPINAPTVDPDTGLLVFTNNATRITAGVAQLPHSWVEGSVLEPHVHWLQAAAGNALWRLEYRLIPAVGALFPSEWTVIESTDGVSTYPGAGIWVQITRLPAIDMTGFKISAMVVFRLSRVGGAAADTLNVDAPLLEFDIHYKSNRLGSFGEFAH